MLHREGSYSILELADLFSVSRPTVYRVLDKTRNGADPVTINQRRTGP